MLGSVTFRQIEKFGIRLEVRNEAIVITGTSMRRVARFALLVRSSMLDEEMKRSRNRIDGNR